MQAGFGKVVSTFALLANLVAGVKLCNWQSKKCKFYVGLHCLLKNEQAVKQGVYQ